MHGRSRMTIDPRNPTTPGRTGTEHVGFSKQIAAVCSAHLAKSFVGLSSKPLEQLVLPRSAVWHPSVPVSPGVIRPTNATKPVTSAQVQKIVFSSTAWYRKCETFTGFCSTEWHDNRIQTRHRRQCRYYSPGTAVLCTTAGNVRKNTIFSCTGRCDNNVQESLMSARSDTYHSTIVALCTTVSRNVTNVFIK